MRDAGSPSVESCVVCGKLAPGWHRCSHPCGFGCTCSTLLSCSLHGSSLTMKRTGKLHILSMFCFKSEFFYLKCMVFHIGREQPYFHLLSHGPWLGSYSSLMYVLSSGFERALCTYLSFTIYFSLTVFFLAFLLHIFLCTTCFKIWGGGVFKRKWRPWCKIIYFPSRNTHFMYTRKTLKPD